MSSATGVNSAGLIWFPSGLGSYLERSGGVCGTPAASYEWCLCPSYRNKPSPRLQVGLWPRTAQVTLQLSKSRLCRALAVGADGTAAPSGSAGSQGAELPWARLCPSLWQPLCGTGARRQPYQGCVTVFKPLVCYCPAAFWPGVSLGMWGAGS